MARDLLRVRNLSTRFFTEEGQVNAADGVSFTVREGEVFGLVGESGAGKSVTARSLLDLIDTPGRITAGEIWYRAPDLARASEETAVDGEFVDVLSLPERVRRSLRGSSFSMIFQDPMSSFDPTVTIGEQIGEAVEVQHRVATASGGASRTIDYGLGSVLLDAVSPSRSFVSDDSLDRAVELLAEVGIPDPAQRADQYPHEFSGGMLQRAMIAQALAGEPDLLVADEPTTALDVTIQAQILQLLTELQDTANLSVVLITHDLGVISQMSDRVGVMYAGEIVEQGSLRDVFEDHVHPYTAGLLDSVPDLDAPETHLEPIGGDVPSLLDSEMSDRCHFADRCPSAMTPCLEEPPLLDAETGAPVSDPGPTQHVAKCVLARREYDEDDAVNPDYFETGGDDR